MAPFSVEQKPRHQRTPSPNQSKTNQQHTNQHQKKHLNKSHKTKKHKKTPKQTQTIKNTKGRGLGLRMATDRIESRDPMQASCHSSSVPSKPTELASPKGGSEGKTPPGLKMKTGFRGENPETAWRENQKWPLFFWGLGGGRGAKPPGLRVGAEIPEFSPVNSQSFWQENPVQREKLRWPWVNTNGIPFWLVGEFTTHFSHFLGVLRGKNGHVLGGWG